MSIIVLTEAEKRFDLLPWLIQLESIGNCTGTDADIQAVTRSILRIGIVARRERDEAKAALAIAQTFLKAQREQKGLMLKELHRLEDCIAEMRKERAEDEEHIEGLQDEIRNLRGERDKLAAELQESELSGPFGDSLKDIYDLDQENIADPEFDPISSSCIQAVSNLGRLKSMAYAAALAYFCAKKEDSEAEDDTEAEGWDDPDACEGLDDEDDPTCEKIEAEAECNEACCGKLSRMEEAMNKASGHP